MESSIENRVIETVIKSLKFERGSFDMQSRLADDLELDSFGNLRLLLAIEDEFNVEVPDEEAEECVTLGDCVALVQRLLSQSSPAA